MQLTSEPYGKSTRPRERAGGRLEHSDRAAGRGPVPPASASEAGVTVSIFQRRVNGQSRDKTRLPAAPGPPPPGAHHWTQTPVSSCGRSGRCRAGFVLSPCPLTALDRDSWAQTNQNDSFASPQNGENVNEEQEELFIRLEP